MRIFARQGRVESLITSLVLLILGLVVGVICTAIVYERREAEERSRIAKAALSRISQLDVFELPPAVRSSRPPKQGPR